MPAPDIIRQLVERFEQHRDAYRSGRYNETQLRREFLDPFFEALGWDVFNKLGYSEENKHVIHEDSLAIEGVKKAPDYAFKIGKERKFFVEAKKPSVKIETNPEFAFQLRRYVWSAKLPLGILSDFEEFAVYECRSKPQVSDSVRTGRVMLLKYTDYIEKWDEIVSIFSNDAVMQGGFDKFANTAAKKKGTVEVDEAFLAEIEGWRETLAKNIALRNKPKIHSEADLNYAVQMIIDRIIFLRICEARGYESENQLQSLAKHENIYVELKKLFEKADRRYNSGLFHFRNEKGRGRADTFTMGLEIDDKVLKEVIRDLYYPSPYVFSQIPADILGQIYEQFLGKVIRLTAGAQAKVEEKPEVRKAGGVFYTPTFIVDNIVGNTLGKLLEGKTPAQAAYLKIVDPACGSGTFLLGAYQYLLDWHLNWYITNDVEKWSKGKNAVLTQSKDGWKLTVNKKKEILLNSIYGVDIDPQAVEVTKLSLLLKVIEDPGQLSYLDERILPDLGKNIQCGNSLIGPDYWEGQLLVSEEDRARVNAFDWKAAFPEVFAQGGFDAVVGNPPYIRIQTLQGWASEQVEYFKRKYKAASKGNYDIYGLFIEKGLDILKSKGLLCFITGSKWLQANYSDNLRDIVKNYVTQILDFGHNQVFENAFVNTCIVSLSKNPSALMDYVSIDKVPELSVVVSALQVNTENVVRTLSIDRAILSSVPWHFSDSSSQTLIEKIRADKISLEGVCSRIYQGLKTSGDKIFLVEIVDESNKDKVRIRSNQLQKEIEVESSLLKPLYRGSQTKRYNFIDEKRAILFPYRRRELIPEKELQQKYPLTYHYFLENRKTLEAREHGKLKGTGWYGYGRSQALDVIGLPKIITPDLARSVSFAWDSAGNVFFVGGAAGGYGLIPKPEWDYRYLLGLLNSRLLDYVIKSQSTQMESGFYSFEARFIRSTPIRAINFSDPADKARHDKMVSLVERMLSLHKSLASTHNPQEADRLMREVESTDRAIDGLVYELYGLTDDEIKVVEGD